MTGSGPEGEKFRSYFFCYLCIYPYNSNTEVSFFLIVINASTLHNSILLFLWFIGPNKGHFFTKNYLQLFPKEVLHCQLSREMSFSDCFFICIALYTLHFTDFSCVN